MPISLTGRTYCYFWSLSNGQYTVRSAYEAMTREDRQMEKDGRNKGETSWTAENERVWK